MRFLARKRIIASTAALAIAASCFANDLPDNLIFSFRRETVQPDKTETLSATAYYRANPHEFFLEVTEPIHQLVFFSLKDTLVYYPDTRKALRIRYERPQTIAEEQGIAVLFSRDKGLERSGYRLDRIASDADGITSIWLPPANLAKAIQGVRVKTDEDDRVISMTTTGTAGRTIQEVFYGAYGVCPEGIPSSVTTRVYQPDGSVAMETRLTVVSATREPIPPGIETFALPEDVEIEEVQW